MPKETGRKLIAQNKKARHDYHLGETVEAGLVLTGTEVKTLRLGRASLQESYAMIDDNLEAWLINAHIPEYEFGTWRNHSARRSRKLLMHRKEIVKLSKQLGDSGRTLVPLELYFSDGRAKVKIAVGTGKKDWDKRRTIAERDANREAQRALRARNRLAR